ncbi:hypothetical protein J2Z19_003269 [Ensifer adhaerens]|uniref:Uncharacterized protein n=1 Tax=Ensifer adhaerens TaxID=106592 RepID=A0ACC5SYS8_ENSAD|nr:hypothetical protein [Ensifer adhaerens]
MNQSRTDAIDELDGVVFHPLAQLIVLGDEISPDPPRAQLVTFHHCETVIFQELAQKGKFKMGQLPPMIWQSDHHSSPTDPFVIHLPSLPQSSRPDRRNASLALPTLI